MSDDPFVTIAVAHSQPQAAVMLSMFGWYGIPAYGMNMETTRINCPLTLALGGIPIRVAREAVEDARNLLVEAVDHTEPPLRSPSLWRLIITVIYFVTGATRPPRIAAVLLD